MKSRDYWIDRSRQRMYKYQGNTKKYTDIIEQAVRGATGRLRQDVQKVLQTFIERHSLEPLEAFKLMNAPVDYESLQRMQTTVKHMPDGAAKDRLIAEIEAKAYGARIDRMRALEIDIKAEMHRLADRVVKATGDSLRNTAEMAYKDARGDITSLFRDNGIGISFDKVDPRVLDQLVMNSWSGKSFSKRTWTNMGILEKKLNTTLREGILRGQSSHKIAQDIEATMQQGLYAAKRLVRTETTHITNAADQVAYKEAGIEEYEYLAALDERTSKICQELNGKRFKVVDAQAGVNLPPMHPNCRSTTVAVFDEDVAEEMASGSLEKIIRAQAKACAF